MLSMQKNDSKVLNDLQLNTILKMMENIKYGSLTIIIQDGKVIQIDKNEKYRINN